MPAHGEAPGILSKLWLMGFRSLCLLLFVLSVVAALASVAAVFYAIAQFAQSGLFGVVIALFCFLASTALARVGWLGLHIKSRADLHSGEPAFPKLKHAVERWFNG